MVLAWDRDRWCMLVVLSLVGYARFDAVLGSAVIGMHCKYEYRFEWERG